MVLADVASMHAGIRSFQKKQSIRVDTIVSKMTAKKISSTTAHNSTAQAEKEQKIAMY
jgi:hypothetical protein